MAVNRLPKLARTLGLHPSGPAQGRRNAAFAVLRSDAILAVRGKVSTMTSTDAAGPAEGADTPVSPAGGTATIALIAAEAGVSVPTASKVLNGRTDVAAVTRARVEEVIDRYQYRRPRGRTSTGPALIDLVFHELDSAWATQIIKGVEEVAGPARVGVVLSELGGAHRPRQEWLDDVLARRPRGVILVLSDLDPAQRRQLETRSIPFVVVDTAGEQPPGVPVVG